MTEASLILPKTVSGSVVVSVEFDSFLAKEIEGLKKVYMQLGEDLIDNKMLTVASTRKLQLFLGKAIAKAEGE